MNISRKFIGILRQNNKDIFSLNISNSTKIFIKKSSIKYNFSTTNNTQQKSLIPYIPIRPLKKHITTLFAQKDFINLGQTPHLGYIWPYLLPFFGLLINNFLTSWNIYNSIGSVVLFVGGMILSRIPYFERQLQILKFQCNNDITKFYMTVATKHQALYIKEKYPDSFKNFQDWGVFTVDDQGHYQYQPTDVEKKTLTQQEISKKQLDFDLKLLKKIYKQDQIQHKISRFQLNASKTKFMLSDNYGKKIHDHQLLHRVQLLKTNEMFDVKQRFLIVKTEFINAKFNTPFHFWIQLEENVDVRYQDYLIALGKNYKIQLNDI